MRERRLVFTSAGDHHRLHPTVRSGAGFDLCVYFYGDEPYTADGLARRGGTLVTRKGAKFENLLAASRHDPDLFSRYDAVLVLDDDLHLTSEEIGKLFDIRQERDLWIVQPSFDPRGRISYPYSVTKPFMKLRFVNFVEMNSPLFRNDKLQQFLRVYDETLIDFGIDWWYMQELGENEPRRYAIVDEICCINPEGRGQGREIDRFGTQRERRATWLSFSDTHGLYEVHPIVLGSESRPLREALPACMRSLRSALEVLTTPGASRGRMLRSWRKALRGLPRRIRTLVTRR